VVLTSLPVGVQVQEAMLQISAGHMLTSLRTLSVAFEISARRHFGVNPTDDTDELHYPRLVKKYMWLISYQAFPGFMPAVVSIPFIHPELRFDKAGKVGFEEIVCYVIHCGITRKDLEETQLVWKDAIFLGLDAERRIVLNPKLIWALILVIVVVPENTNEQIDPGYWLTVGDFKAFVDELWGKTDLVKRMVESLSGMKVDLQTNIQTIH
jgi:hypothetical protein